MKRLAIALVILSTGCATFSNRTKGIIATVTASAGGAAVGVATAPVNERPEMHGIMWGAVAGLATAIVSQFIFDEGARSSEFERRNEILRKELEVFRPETASASKPEEMQAGLARMNDQLPESVKGLVRAGKWTHTKFPSDKWIQKGDHYLVRECEAFTLIPPSIQVPSSGGAVAPQDSTTTITKE